MKKFYLILLTIFGLFSSCTNDTDALNEEADLNVLVRESQAIQDNVNLVHAWTSNESSPVHKKYLRRFSVRVKNIAYEKKVIVHHLTTNGNWVDIPLSYKQNIPIGYEIWEGEIASDTQLYGDKFAIKYEVDGMSYWDNNGGNDYNMPVSIGAYLAADKQIVLDTYYTRAYGKNVTISADVRENYFADATNVEVVYTTDGWANTQKADLKFQQYYRVGYADYIFSPNQYDISKYATTLRLSEDVSAVEYFVLYTVDGNIYRDNNYGNNYRQINLN